MKLSLYLRALCRPWLMVLEWCVMELLSSSEGLMWLGSVKRRETVLAWGWGRGRMGLAPWDFLNWRTLKLDCEMSKAICVSGVVHRRDLLEGRLLPHCPPYFINNFIDPSQLPHPHYRMGTCIRSPVSWALQRVERTCALKVGAGVSGKVATVV